MEGPGPLLAKAWHLPVAVIGIVLPIIAAIWLGGAPAGMGVAFLVAATIVIVAARSKPREPIELARDTDAAGRVLVIACTPLDAPPAIEAISAAADAVAGDAAADRPVDVLVVVPAFSRRLAHWLSDLSAARLAAQERLAVSLAGLAAAGLDAHGRVGDPDPLVATEDALRAFAVDRVVFVSEAEDERSRAAAEDVYRRSTLPMRHLVLAGTPVN